MPEIRKIFDSFFVQHFIAYCGFLLFNETLDQTHGNKN
jgi:hypothetical protein